MTTYSLDAESFINEIKKYRELWDVSVGGNKFKTKDKLHAWASVAKVFIPDFDNMKDIEKSEVYRKLNSKWRNLRDAYVRNLRRKDGKRNYMYAKHLSFLNSRYNNNQTSEDDTTDDEKHDTKTYIETATNSDDETSTIVNLKRRRVERKEAIEFVDTPNVPVDMPSLPTVDTSYVDNEDRSFFDSLLPAVRRFDLDQKLEFRCGVLKLIKQIRSETTNFKNEFSPVDYVN